MFAKVRQLLLSLSSKTSAASCKHMTDFAATGAEIAEVPVDTWCPLGTWLLDAVSTFVVQQLEGSCAALCLI